MTKPPKLPSHLRPATKRWLRSLWAEYDFQEHHHRLGTLAGEAWDRCCQAREALAIDGLTFRDNRGNIRPHPLISVEKDSRIAFARLVRELDLDADDGGPDFRPPPLRSNRGR